MLVDDFADYIASLVLFTDEYTWFIGLW